ncbi:bifunctional nuclease domain-containing protein [Geobacter sp.]|uniref:bifunctional nuclease family protein n=1 Tax=Geobacter sp. TaxID=46610 RepID=UPI002638F963|nr:bifunctional nuclease domain-containing protein [Geobacter sp.]
MTDTAGARGKVDDRPAYVKMSIYGFALDSIAQMPVVILKDAEETNTLPLWLNSSDALYMVAELVSSDASAKSDRKDLLAALLDHLGTEVAEVAIDDMKEGLVTASVSLELGGKMVKLGVRTSEALVLALKHSLPVMVARRLLEDSPLVPDESEGRFTRLDERRFVDFLENLDPADLGKYPM